MPLENFTYGNIFFDIEHPVHAGKTFMFFNIKSRFSFKIFLIILCPGFEWNTVHFHLSGWYSALGFFGFMLNTGLKIQRIAPCQ